MRRLGLGRWLEGLRIGHHIRSGQDLRTVYEPHGMDTFGRDEWKHQTKQVAALSTLVHRDHQTGSQETDQ